MMSNLISKAAYNSVQLYLKSVQFDEEMRVSLSATRPLHPRTVPSASVIAYPVAYGAHI